jgi:Bacterial alpha-L-rhamnosidase 6 hairpin glycosidase domain
MTANLFQPARNIWLCLVVLFPFAASRAATAIRIETDPNHAVVRFLGWDTETGERANTNLLRTGAGVCLRVRIAGQWRSCAEMPARRESPTGSSITYHLLVAPEAELIWKLDPKRESISTRISGRGKGWKQVEGLELVFPFDPRVTPTTVLPKSWNDDGSLRLPAIISAPDFGQMLLSHKGGARVFARLEGSRARHKVDLVVTLPTQRAIQTFAFSLTPVHLPAPKGLKDKALWRAARRGWFGAFQCSAQWGDPGNPFSAPAGMLANNVISDPASCSLWFYADQAFWTPKLAAGISAMSLVRRTLDWWLDKKVLPSGEVICYWDKTNFLDANAGPLIAAWDCVETTGDKHWLTRRIERLEFIADFLAKRDVDGDGLVEATQSGNYGTLKEPARSCAWWDALNCGYKDSYSNALIYRAWRCLAALEAKLKRREQQYRYTQLADRLKAAYFKTLYNPQTGWLAWWKSKDGQLHDYASPIINGLAIEYGLVEPAQGREILTRLRNKIREVGFTRFDLGVPPMLVPVRRGDYLLPDAAGCPKRQDGTDTFGYYMNGGITAGQVLHFLAAHYVVGEAAKADKILRAMLERQAHGGFQNGAVNAYPKGIDWTTWDGKPAGYEGYLADSFRFLQAVLLREKPFRERLYRPLLVQSRDQNRR